jgi:tetratricopeptide (TPR) repeat protein
VSILEDYHRSVVEHYHRSVASELKHARWDCYVESSRQSIRDVREAELLGQITSVEQSVSRAAAMAEWAFPAVVSLIVQNNALLSQLVELTANPRSVAATESVHMGLHALRNGWHSDSIAEFERAISDNRYDSATHFALGCAYAAMQDFANAGSSFTRAVRYGLADSKEIACGAALFGAQSLRRAGDTVGADSLLLSVVERVPDCPEVALAYARSSNDKEVLHSALTFAPELALDAAAAEIDGVEEVCRNILVGSAGLTARLDESGACLNELSRLDRDDLRSTWKVETNDVPFSVQLAMTAVTLVSANQTLRRSRGNVQHEFEREAQELERVTTQTNTNITRAEERQRRDRKVRDKGTKEFTVLATLILLAIVATSIVATTVSGGSVEESWVMQNAGYSALWLLLIIGCPLLWLLALVKLVKYSASHKEFKNASNSDARRVQSAERSRLKSLEGNRSDLGRRKAEFDRLSRRIEHAIACLPVQRTVPFYGNHGTRRALGSC